jgi:hypothetical protein
MKKINIFKIPLFYFHGNCGKVCPTDFDFFLTYLVPLDVDVTENITANICEVWSEFNILHLGYHGKSRHSDFFNTQKLPHTMVDIPTKYHEV